jgi:hypothetical protein
MSVFTEPADLPPVTAAVLADPKEKISAGPSKKGRWQKFVSFIWDQYVCFVS